MLCSDEAGGAPASHQAPGMTPQFRHRCCSSSSALSPGPLLSPALGTFTRPHRGEVRTLSKDTAVREHRSLVQREKEYTAL